MYVYIKADKVSQVGKNLFQATIPDGEPISEEDRDALNRLFPNLISQAERLLDKEAIFRLMPTDDEIRIALTPKPTDDVHVSTKYKA